MAGVTDAIDLDLAVDLASLMVAAGRVPPPSAWVDGLVAARQESLIEGFF